MNNELAERNISLKDLEDAKLLTLEKLVAEVTKLMRKYIYLPDENKTEKENMKKQIDKMKNQIMKGKSK